MFCYPTVLSVNLSLPLLSVLRERERERERERNECVTGISTFSM